jgi:hypothetical protein
MIANRQTAPLEVIINPPDVFEILPGQTRSLSVVVTNKARQGAIVEVSLDLPSTLRPWCKVARESFNLAMGASQEILFEWQVPDQANPNPPERPFHEYVLMVDAPTNNFLAAPILHSLKLRVQTPTRADTARKLDPTFSIDPVTTSTKPAIIQLGQPFQLIVEVHNRSRFVDDFRLACPDLDDDWIRIRYPEAFETLGAIAGGMGLRLNPNTKGEITVEINPPPEAFAGNYSPTLRIHSAVDPQLLLQDIIYIHIPPKYEISAELVVILDKVKTAAGQYEIVLANQGNTNRKLKIDAQTADEEELCNYELTTKQVLIPPGRTVKVGLQVDPKDKKKRPRGLGRQLSFWVNITDIDGLELPKNVPLKGGLFWEAKALWPFLIGIVLGIFGAVGLGVILFFYLRARLRPKPVSVVKFEPTEFQYVSPNPITLGWQIDNPKQLTAITITGTSKEQPQPIEISYTRFTKEGIPEDIAGNCAVSNNRLSCTGIPTEAREVGEYTLTLTVEAEKDNLRKEPFSQRIDKVVIEPPVSPKISELQVLSGTKISKGDPIRLAWKITDVNQVATLRILDSESVRVVRTYTGEQLKTYRCLPPEAGNKKPVSCQGIIITDDPENPLDIGPHKFRVETLPVNEKMKPDAQETGVIEITPPAFQPVELSYFWVNNSPETSYRIPVDTEAILSWEITGDIKEDGVKLFVGNTSTIQDPVAEIPIPTDTPRTFTLRLEVTDVQGTKHQLGDPLTVEIVAPSPEPTETPSLNPSDRNAAAPPANPEANPPVTDPNAAPPANPAANPPVTDPNAAANPPANPEPTVGSPATP